MNKEQIKANFKAAHAAQLSKVANAQFNQMDAAAELANQRIILRGIERQFKEDMAQPDTSAQLELPGMVTSKK
jgi:hypothetical protein